MLTSRVAALGATGAAVGLMVWWNAGAGESPAGAAGQPAPAATRIVLSCPARGPFGVAGPYHSQYYEDYILSHVFGDVATGSYVDVGANDPDAMSVTKYFYLKGWRGVNIEPNPDHRAKLQQSRPADENLEVGISDGVAVLRFYRFDPPHHGLSTFDPAIADRHAKAGFRFEELTIPVMTLNDALGKSARVRGGFDFISIDVEGFELKVLSGLDFARFPPTVVMIEATAPLTEAPTHQNWESVLYAAGYLFALDDGLNRYYVHPSRQDLLPRFLEADHCVGLDKIAKRVKLDGFMPVPN